MSEPILTTQLCSFQSRPAPLPVAGATCTGRINNYTGPYLIRLYQPDCNAGESSIIVNVQVLNPTANSLHFLLINILSCLQLVPVC